MSAVNVVKTEGKGSGKNSGSKKGPTAECPKCGTTMKFGKAEKPKRAPTEYNLYFKKHMAGNKWLQDLPDATAKMKCVAQFWNAYKKNGKKPLTNAAQLVIVREVLKKAKEEEY